MSQRRRTLGSMDRGYERLLADVCDVVLEQGGDWAATEAALAAELVGEAFDDALNMAQVPLIIYSEPGLGPGVVRNMRDRRRQLVPADPARRRWSFRATG